MEYREIIKELDVIIFEYKERINKEMGELKAIEQSRTILEQLKKVILKNK